MAEQATGARKLATVMFLDMVAYSALMSRNEAKALGMVRRLETILRQEVPAYGGKLVKFMGDGSMAMFETAGAAVACALKIQEAISSVNLSSAADDRFAVRIGLHLGELLEQDNDLYGEAVNIAARIQPLADPDGIAMTETVYAQVKNHMKLRGTMMAGIRLKNITGRFSVFFVAPPEAGYLRWYVRRHWKVFARAIAVVALAGAAVGVYLNLMMKRDVLFEDFADTTDLWTSVSSSATLFLDAVRSPTGTSLKISYEEGFWMVGKNADALNGGGWGDFTGIRLTIRGTPGNKVRIILVERNADASSTRIEDEKWAAPLSLTRDWTVVTVPFSSFAITGDGYIEDYRRNGILDADRIHFLAFTDEVGVGERGILEVDNVSLIRRKIALPSQPVQPRGPTAGSPRENLRFKSIAAASRGSDEINYVFDWGDGTTSETPLQASGTEVMAGHAWKNGGTFKVRVCAVNREGATSDWSEPLVVVITDILENFTDIGDVGCFATGGGSVFVESRTEGERSYLHVEYSAPNDKVSWAVKKMATVIGDGDWSPFLGIAFEARSANTRYAQLQLIEKPKTADMWEGEFWEADFEMQKDWGQVLLRFDEFKLKPYWQPAGADGNERLDLDKILEVRVCKSYRQLMRRGEFDCANLRLTRESATVQGEGE